MTYSHYPIHEKADFDADLYAEAIEKALKSGEEDKVGKLLVEINNSQRQKIHEPYRIKYGKTLKEALENEFFSDSLTLMLALIEGPLEFDVQQLELAIEKKFSKPTTALIEIICSRTPEQLKAINAFYNKKHEAEKMTLTKKIIKDVSGEFKDILVDLVNGSKNGGQETNDAQAHQDAERLFTDGKGTSKEGAGESHFRTILTTQNMYQLRKVFAEFKELSGHAIDQFIEKEFGEGKLKDTYLAIVHATENKQKYFATQIRATTKGAGTRNHNLIRGVVARSEIDLNIIKDEYKLMYDRTIEHHIKKDTSGVYRDILVAICAGNRA